MIKTTCPTCGYVSFPKKVATTDTRRIYACYKCERILFDKPIPPNQIPKAGPLTQSSTQPKPKREQRFLVVATKTNDYIGTYQTLEEAKEKAALCAFNGVRTEITIENPGK